MRRRAVLVLIPVAGLLARPGPAAQAAQQRLSARADTYVDAARPHRAYGRRASLRISSSPPRRAYVRFAVPRLGSRLTRATLLLAVARRAGRLKVRRVSGSWSERGTTYARTPRARG